jgi:hypothetical protein
MPNRTAGNSVFSFLDLDGPRLAVLAVRETFFETGLLTVALRADRAFLAAGLFAELFFLVGFAIGTS